MSYFAFSFSFFLSVSLSRSLFLSSLSLSLLRCLALSQVCGEAERYSAACNVTETFKCDRDTTYIGFYDVCIPGGLRVENYAHLVELHQEHQQQVQKEQQQQ